MARRPKQKTIGINSLSAKILCSRHNRALSPLDNIASEFFGHVRDDLLDMNWHAGNPPEFLLRFHAGEWAFMEPWFLRFCGAQLKPGP